MRTEGALTWRYVGQATHSDATDMTAANPREFSFVYEERGSQSVVEQLIGTISYGANGEIWMVEAVDESRLTTPEGEERADSTDPAASLTSSQDWPTEGEVVTWSPMSWTSSNCDSDPEKDVRLWDGDSRSLANLSWSRSKTAVNVEFHMSNGLVSSCSGVMIRDQWVLTAAHCLFDANNNVPIITQFINQLNVELEWASESEDAEIYFINSSYNPSAPDYSDDYALIKLESAFSASPPDMDLSTAGDSVLQGVGAHFHHLGFPHWFPSMCQTTSADELVHAGDYDVTAFQNVRLRWKGDHTKGQSGGPLYYCPTGDDSVCASGETGFVVSLLAGYNSAYDRFVGPRVSEWQSWAINIMDNN